MHIVLWMRKYDLWQYYSSDSYIISLSDWHWLSKSKVKLFQIEITNVWWCFRYCRVDCLVFYNFVSGCGLEMEQDYEKCHGTTCYSACTQLQGKVGWADGRHFKIINSEYLKSKGSKNKAWLINTKGKSLHLIIHAQKTSEKILRILSVSWVIEWWILSVLVIKRQNWLS